MKTLKKINKNSILIALSIPLALGFSVLSAYAATTPSLGTAGTFGILAHNYGRNGNPGPAVTGDFGYTTLTGTSLMPTVSGSTHVANGSFTQAGADQNTALASLNSQPCTFVFPNTSNLDLATDTTHGTLGVYTPGVYCVNQIVPSVALGAAGITLNGSGTYIFRINGSLKTSANSHVTLSNGASACNVFWTPVDNAVVSMFGFSSTFVGTVIDNHGFSVADSVTWLGRALAFEGNISMASNDAISVPLGCTPSPTTATLHVIKVFYNDYGGNAVPFDATIHVKNGGVDVAGSPQSGAVSPGTSYTLNPGTYTVSEDAFPGYSAIYGNDDCDYGGNVTLAPGDNKTCTVSNDENPPSFLPATLHVIKVVINDNGGTAVVSDAVLHVKNGMGDVSGSPQAGASGPGGTTYVLNPGTYAVSENAFPGYTSSFSGDCDSSGNVTLASSDNKKCTIINDDIAPHILPATLHVIKKVINDNGGTAIASSFNLYVKSAGSFGMSNVAGSPAAGVGSPGRSYSLAPGTYAVSEDAFPGYTQSFSGSCDSNGNITLASGDNDATCTITNDDKGQTSLPATLHVIKKVINNDGGTDIASSFNLYVKSSGSFGLNNVAGSPAPGVGSPGRSYSLATGTYAVSEDAHSGYAQSFSGDCDSSGTITLASGDDKICTITNDDDKLPPPPFAFLHVIKKVINNNGGTATPSSFTLNVKLGSAQVVGSPASGVPAPGTLYTLAAGTYKVSENAFVGYTQSFGSDCAGGTVTLVSGDNKTCTVTNDDIGKPSPKTKTATLHIIKKVINDNGGTAIPASFTLSVKKGFKQVIGSPAPGASAPGTLYTLKAGAYTVSEKAFAGYTKSFSGDCDAKGKVKLKLGDDKTCTITNDDTDKKSPPVIHVVKSAFPLELPPGGGMVAYSYTVTNPGTVPLVNVSLSDDKCSPILGPTGDSNKNKQLDLTEKWNYTCTTVVTKTTRNTVVATGIGGGSKVTDSDEAKVFVKAPGFPDTAATSTGLPVRVKIPTIKVSAPVHPVGLTPEGDMGKPSGPADVVWYKFGTLPGEIGTAVIAGHFGHWLSGSGSVFDRLHELKPGDKLTLEDDKGVVTTFVVRASQLYDPKADTTDIFDSDDGLSHLNIITCSGTFNPKTKSFPKRLVVFTDKE